jgi:hypothetical protein
MRICTSRSPYPLLRPRLIQRVQNVSRSAWVKTDSASKTANATYVCWQRRFLPTRRKVPGFSENKGVPLYSENGIFVTTNREPNIRGPPCIRHFGVSVLCKYVQIFLRNIRGPPYIRKIIPNIRGAPLYLGLPYFRKNPVD